MTFFLTHAWAQIQLCVWVLGVLFCLTMSKRYAVGAYRDITTIAYTLLAFFWTGVNALLFIGKVLL